MDQAMHLSELYYRAVEWGKARGIGLDERYIHEQMEEALKRQEYGDPIGATVNIMHANAGMLAEQFSPERIKSLYTYFDVRANGSISLDSDNIDGMLSAMDDFFGLCEQVRQAKPPADIQEQIKNEGEALRSLLAVKADIAKPIGKVADVLKDKLGELLSEHDCDSCKLDKSACPLVTSGVDIILRKTDDYLRALVLQDIDVLEAIIKQYEPDNFGITKIREGYMDKDALASRYSLTCITALTFMAAHELTIGECMSIMDVLHAIPEYSKRASQQFVQQADLAGLSKSALAKLARDHMSVQFRGAMKMMGELGDAMGIGTARMEQLLKEFLTEKTDKALEQFEKEGEDKQDQDNIADRYIHHKVRFGNN